MAFQDNSGDIILDVVLTDEGRRRLAKGDGSFRIMKFALGDEEINYELYNTNHTSGSSHYDLEILQTPILEAFTNNTSTMKTKLVSIPRNDLLYLPILKLNEVSNSDVAMHTSGSFMVTADRNTEDNTDTGGTTSIAIASDGSHVPGFILGATLGSNGSYIRVDAGINNENSTTSITDTSLIETQFMIEIDNRLGQLVSTDGSTRLSPDSVDDDNMATYILSRAINPKFVMTPAVSNETSTVTPIQGPVFANVMFKILSSQSLQTGYFLFNKIGGTTTMQNYAGGLSNVKFVDTIVRVSGVTTGYSLDIPVRFVKLY